jgi:chemotaxis protein histidine kinase CheA
MGIGAYQVRDYVQQAGGTVEVSSSPGIGTRFCITLPASMNEIDSAVLVPASAAAANSHAAEVT